MAVFCGCFPIRAGTIALCALQILIGATTATFFWWDVLLYVEFLSVLQKSALFLSASANALLALVALFGLIGAVARHWEVLRAFWFMQMVQTGISVAAGAMLLIALFATDGRTSVGQCVGQHVLAFPTLGSAGSKAQCEQLLQAAKYVYGAHLAILLAIQAYAIITIKSYMDDLYDGDWTRQIEDMYFAPEEHKHKQTITG
ncbi:hypothetical protein BKA62DRAFT_758339 [Auriculariales sp. MPI-PUGE-AT-0066]|nr:hypothetical protein BKA62DRAFT_758339 [Auriculariales sp. MPI-PUGE-AT-0066]